MTEQEYIDATNLAKVRAAISILRDYLPLDAKHDSAFKDSVKKLYELQDALSSIVKINQ